MNGVVTPREGNRQRGYLQGVYPTAVDGEWVAISVRDDVGLDHDAFDEAVAAWTETLLALRRGRYPYRTRSSRRTGAHRRPDVRHRTARRPRATTKNSSTRSRAHTAIRDGRFASRPGLSTTTDSPPPTLGQHNDEVLRGLA